MKAGKLLQLIYLLPILFFGACTDEFSEFEQKDRVEEGLPAYIQLGFKAEDNTVITRAEQDEISESTVDNVYLIVFKEDGSVHGRRFCTPGDGLTYTDGNTGKNTGKLFLETRSLNNARIVGIANLTTETTSTAYSISAADLDKITTLDELKALHMKMRAGSIERGGLFMMTGFAKDKNNPDNEFVTIPGGEGSTQTLNATLKLERTDAKIKFIVKTDPAKTEWKDFSFLPKEWTVKRVPMQSYILEASQGDYEGTDATYFTSNTVVFEEITRNETNPNLYTGGSFVFYMPENRKTPKKQITQVDGERTLYAQRESWSQEDENGDKIFTNANANSTYVEMTGTLSYVDSKGLQVSADVRFTVHLGFATGDANDYNTDRNSYYTYNVTVRGIDDIIYEVDKQDDRRPGYEGDVVYSSDQIFEFDSHYDRRLITLNRNIIENDMKWSVITPFSRGIHEMGQPIEENMRDYRWIKFAINYDYNVTADKYVKYPGDQNYNDPYPMEGAANNQPSPYYSPEGAGYNAERKTDEARLLDIDQLITRLQTEVNNPDSKIFDASGNVAITAFVDENLYFNHPITNEPGENNRSLWKLTSDKEDRQLHIIAGGSQNSPDGNSSIVHSQYSFKQRSIRTIFNVDNPNLTTAWGLESVMETKRMGAGTVSTSSSTSNGRLNTLYGILGTNYQNNRNVTWTSIVGTDKDYSLQGDQTALRACLLRNRDLNGDNIVDANEIRWYLTSIDQLTDIYLGEYALDEKSRLYPSNAADRENKVRWHYTSSSRQSGTTPWILWAEEGASRGGAGGSKNDNDQQNYLFSYRCARNLGLSLNDPNEIPVDLITVTKEESGHYLIDLSRMNPKSLRTNFETRQLPPHNERDANNRPYVKFRVHKDVSPTPNFIRGLTWSWNTQPWSYYQTWSDYPAGYRIPNQRELLIMATRMPVDAWETFWDRLQSITPDYVSQTAFSLNGKPPYSKNRHGFMWHSSNREFFLQNDDPEKGYVRPVQDVQ